jgi:EAL domain-containing protein (putative c-di-GMP-specific phosphodiesterase class I)/CheY-like chemotaxis protein
MTRQPKILVIDDEVDHATLVCEIAQQAGFEAEKYTNASLFMEQYNEPTDVIILDLVMPGVDGIEIIRYLANKKCNALLILMSGFDSGVLHSAQKLAKEQGLNFVSSLNKPIRPKQLKQLLKELPLEASSEISYKKTAPPTLDELKDAFKNNELMVFYQPKIGLVDNNIIAVEALVRWQHPNYGIVAPDLFIPLAEENNLIDQLTWVVFDQALSQCKRWTEQGLTVQIAINMSASTLKELSLPDKIDLLLNKHGINAQQIVLEITESALMSELITSLDILTRLRMKGIRLSIDDFGTGYSSLLQLHRVPFSEIKIDRTFVSEMENDTEAAAIVETIIMLGQKLGMKTVAEGIETKETQAKLTTLGCNLAQGYLFSKPIPGEDIFAWFTEYKRKL